MNSKHPREERAYQRRLRRLRARDRREGALNRRLHDLIEEDEEGLIDSGRSRPSPRRHHYEYDEGGRD